MSKTRTGRVYRVESENSVEQETESGEREDLEVMAETEAGMTELLQMLFEDRRKRDEEAAARAREREEENRRRERERTEEQERRERENEQRVRLMQEQIEMMKTWMDRSQIQEEARTGQKIYDT